jgi:hypothetical protein
MRCRKIFSYRKYIQKAANKPVGTAKLRQLQYSDSNMTDNRILRNPASFRPGSAAMVLRFVPMKRNISNLNGTFNVARIAGAYMLQVHKGLRDALLELTDHCKKML